MAKAAEIQEAIQDGARAFLATEFKYMGIFMVGARCNQGKKTRPAIARLQPPPCSSAPLAAWLSRGTPRDQIPAAHHLPPPPFLLASRR